MGSTTISGGFGVGEWFGVSKGEWNGAIGHFGGFGGFSAACSTGTGTPLKDALVEIWQADAEGSPQLAPAETRAKTADQNFKKPPAGAAAPGPTWTMANSSSRRSSPGACRSTTAD